MVSEEFTFNVVVVYDGSLLVFNGSVVSNSVNNAEIEVCDIIYNEGIINPYLHSVYQKLSFKIERVK